MLFHTSEEYISFPLNTHVYLQDGVWSLSAIALQGWEPIKQHTVWNPWLRSMDMSGVADEDVNCNQLRNNFALW